MSLSRPNRTDPQSFDSLLSKRNKASCLAATAPDASSVSADSFSVISAATTGGRGTGITTDSSVIGGV